MKTREIKFGNYSFTEHTSMEIGTNEAQYITLDAIEIGTLTAVVKSDDSDISSIASGTMVYYSENNTPKQVFRLRSVDRIGLDTYQINAVTTIALLASQQHYGGIYTGETATEIINDICADIPVIIKTDLEDVKLYGWLPIATARENFAQVLFALGATVKTDLNGVLRIEGLWSGLSGIISAGRIYSDAKVEYSSKITQVRLIEHQYAQNAGQTSRQLFQGTTQAGDIITFTEPMYNVTATGFTVLEKGANYARVSAGSGVLTGTPYLHTTRQLVQTLVTGPAQNVVSAENKTLVSLTNSADVLGRMVEYYKHSETINASFLLKSEKPGDVVRIYHPYNKEINSACLMDMGITMSSVDKAQSNMLVNYIPPRPAAQYYDSSLLFTSNTTWTVPENVTSALIVLIGGGDGGNGGRNGGSGRSGSSSGNGSGGSGGAAGIRGNGGRIYQATIDVSPGQTYPITIGAGGTGGSANGSGGAGGATTFGLHSSASGSASSEGYTDITTGRTYGIPGASDGIAGASGSSKSTGSSVTYSGRTYSGGYAGSSVTGTGNYEGITAYGGGGGGAAAGVNGGAGSSATYSSFSYGVRPNNGGAGGRGASAAIAGANGAVYGQGGSGGFGGGGGGGMYHDNYGSGLNKYGAGGPGGAGSRGGDGYQGCVLLYYSQIVTRRYGWVHDKNGKRLLGRYKRKIIV